MNAIIEKLPALVTEELEAANLQHTVFHSPHEGYAVLLEEYEESAEELEGLSRNLRDLWGAIKMDDQHYGRNFARMVETKAIRLAAEAIQVAAMARKFQALESEQWGGRNAD